MFPKAKEYFGDKPASKVARMIADAGWYVLMIFVFVFFLWRTGNIPNAQYAYITDIFAVVLAAILVGLFVADRVALWRGEYKP